MSEPQSAAPPDDGRGGIGSHWTGPEWDEKPIRAPRQRNVLQIIVLSIAGLVVVGGSVIFLFGQDLFGSDRGSIDSYNREVLGNCDLPAESTLLRTYITPVVDQSGQPLRAMTYVYASPLPASDVAVFYGVERIGVPTLISSDQQCPFGNRPSLLVADETTTTLSDQSDEFWGGDDTVVTEITEPPGETQSLFGLRLAQREVEGIFD